VLAGQAFAPAADDGFVVARVDDARLAFPAGRTDQLSGSS
jgi:hypothetical protein